jgi:glycosyltransferase involved in cell wall biosynthesis
MKILWFAWKDKKNPYAGGAEVVSSELAKRLVNDGHEVTFIVRGHVGEKDEEMIDGYRVIRLGNWKSVYWKAYQYYKKNLVGWADLVIDEVNTIPFFCKFYVKEKNILFFHQLCRKIWFYEMRFPMNLVGYLAEPVYLWLLNNKQVVTVSESTRKDLMKYGFRKERIRIISEGILLEPAENIDTPKFEKPTLLSLGAMRPMKRTDHILKAFEIAKEKMADLEFKIAGSVSGPFGGKVVHSIDESLHRKSIQYLGMVDEAVKLDLMRRSHLIAVTSVKEGWGLIVTEAASQGTPAVVYDIDGLRDSVRHGKTGLISEENTPERLSERIVQLLSDREKYEEIRRNAWQWSKEINFEKSYIDFKQIIKSNCEEAVSPPENRSAFKKIWVNLFQ